MKDLASPFAARRDGTLAEAAAFLRACDQEPAPHPQCTTVYVTTDDPSAVAAAPFCHPSERTCLFRRDLVSGPLNKSDVRGHPGASAHQAAQVHRLVGGGTRRSSSTRSGMSRLEAFELEAFDALLCSAAGAKWVTPSTSFGRFVEAHGPASGAVPTNAGYSHAVHSRTARLDALCAGGAQVGLGSARRVDASWVVHVCALLRGLWNHLLQPRPGKGPFDGWSEERVKHVVLGMCGDPPGVGTLRGRFNLDKQAAKQMRSLVGAICQQAAGGG